jgi:hypothetical protein
MKSPLFSKEIMELASNIDGQGSEKEHESLRVLEAKLAGQLPNFLLELFKKSKNRGTRAACIFYCLGWARDSEAAKVLALLAVKDKSYIVRYRACQLLAYSLDKGLLSQMEKLRNQSEKKTQDDLDAAMDAISNQNHHFFKDRLHTGKVFMNLASD